MTIDIDRSAPLSAARDTFIAAPLEKVWSVQTDIDRWSEWQSDVSSAKLEGALALGTIFRWKALGLNITSQIADYEPSRRIGWTGKSLGMQAIHLWAFEPENGGTRVRTRESLSGWFPRLLKLFDPNFLGKSLEGSLQKLKARAEQS